MIAKLSFSTTFRNFNFHIACFSMFLLIHGFQIQVKSNLLLLLIFYFHFNCSANIGLRGLSKFVDFLGYNNIHLVILLICSGVDRKGPCTCSFSVKKKKKLLNAKASKIKFFFFFFPRKCKLHRYQII